MGLVSIITPCYNSEKFIEETYQSIKKQRYQNWEWIIVDDCSTDCSTQIIQHFDDNRVNLIIQPFNQGAAKARNKALSLAKGQYITFIDSDDLWLPDFLNKTIEYLQATNEELVYTSYRRVNENLEPILNDFIAIDKVDQKRILYNCPIPMLTSVYDVSRIGIVEFPHVELREDHAMWIELLRKIKYARAIEESLALYRMRENSVSRNKLTIAIKQYDVYRKYLKMNFFVSCYYTFFWAINGLKKYGKL